MVADLLEGTSIAPSNRALLEVSVGLLRIRVGVNGTFPMSIEQPELTSLDL